MSTAPQYIGTIDAEDGLGSFSLKKFKKFVNPITQFKANMAIQNPLIAAHIAKKRRVSRQRRAAHALHGLIDDDTGLGKTSLGKKLKKVVKSKGFKVAAAAVATYYGGGALMKAAKAKKMAKGAKLVKGVAKKKGKSKIFDSIAKFGKKNKKGLVAAGVLTAGAMVGNRATNDSYDGSADNFIPKNTYENATGNTIKAPILDIPNDVIVDGKRMVNYDGKMVDYDMLNPAAKDRYLMQQGSNVNANGMPWNSGEAPKTKMVDTDGDGVPDTEVPISGAGMFDTKTLIIGAVAVGALFMISRKG